MRSLKALLRDSKRSQQGSVLSGVLIITLFIGIIVGALMTELSTNLLLSRVLIHRVNNQATVNSAIELAIGQMEGAPIGSGCPGLSSTTVNGLTAATSYFSCAPIVDPGQPQYTTLASSSAFSVDGTYTSVQSPGGNEYLVGDSSGRVWRFAGQQQWSADVGTSLTAPPMSMPDGSTILVPVTSLSGCGQSQGCVASIQLFETSAVCYMVTDDTVTGRPAAGINFPGLAYMGDASGNVFAFDASAGSCSEVAESTANNNQRIVGGPIVFQGVSGKKLPTDEIFILQSDSSGSQLEQIEVARGKKGGFSLTNQNQLGLNGVNAVGLSVDASTLPARIAITYANGLVEIVRISTSLNMSTIAVRSAPAGIADAPTWCCGSNPTTLGVGGTNGSLYVLDSSLKVIGSYALGGPIRRSPDVDAGGDWFVGSDDGNIYEVSTFGSNPFPPFAYGGSQLGAIRSAVQVAPCNNGKWLCAYAASSSGYVYEIDLSARQVVMSGCISTSPPACSTGDNPRLLVTAQIGSAGSSTMVQPQVWSYYSP